MSANAAPVAKTGPSDRAGAAPRRWPAHIVVPAIVAVAIGAVVLVSARQVLRPATPIDVRPVVFTGAAATIQVDGPTARRGTTVQAPGWLEADPFYVACTALTDGIVEEMLVLEGQRVEAGQIVARLVAEDAELSLAASEADLATAQAQLAVMEADVRAARTDWENPVERERAVRVWQAALAETEAELVQLPALVDVERAKHERLVEEFGLARKAQERGGATPIEVIILDKQTAAQAATVESIRRKEGILTARRDRLKAEVTAATRNFELRVDERRALDGAEAAAMRAKALVNRARARRDADALRLQRMVIRAPITGLVQRRLKVPGDKIMLAMDDVNSAHLLHLYDPEHLQVRVDVPLADAAGVFVGQRCEVIVEVLSDVTFAGEVTRITHEADLQKNTLQVKVRVFEPDPVLKPEMLTRVRFLAEGGGPKPGAAGASLRVPAECLSRVAGTDEVRVWVVRDRRGRRGRSMPVAVVVLETGSVWVTVQGRPVAGRSPGDRGRRPQRRAAGSHQGRRGRRRCLVNLIECRDLTREYRKGDNVIRPLDGVDLDVERGEFLALMGPSGSGKTTLLNLIAGIDTPTAGSIRIDGVMINELSRNRLAAWRSAHVGYVFQLYNLVPVLTAFENVELPLLLQKLSRTERRKRTWDALQAVGIADRHDHFPRQMSGGQEQRVAIARAIVTDPPIIVADEPTGDLDKTAAEDVMTQLKLLNVELHKTVILVTHDPHTTAYASRTIYLDKGRFVSDRLPGGMAEARA